MEDDESDKKYEEEKEEDINKSNRKLLIAIAVVAGIFLILFLIPAFKEWKEQPKTIDQVHDAIIAGEEVEEGYLYNGYSFVQVGNLWYTRIQIDNLLYEVPLHYGPRDLEDVIITGELNDTFHSKNVYITFDPSDEKTFGYIALAAAELSLNLVKAIGVTPIAACTMNVTDACATRPIITCEQGDKAIIYIREDNETLLDLRGNCIIIRGHGEEMMKATDRLILQWYGIMN